ncbi:MAG: hypothetical protein ACFCUU_10475, partial [Cyclobacteriaceae bacterium]
MKTLSTSYFIGILLLASLSSQGNNLKLSDLSLIDEQTLQFSVSWNNAWHLPTHESPGNHDAVWIFLKYQKAGENTWKHLHVSDEVADHQSFSGQLLIEAQSDKMGILLLPAQHGNIDVEQTMVEVKLDIPLNDPGHYRFKIFGIEMVYVPEASFYAGDGVSNFSLIHAESKNPFLVSSEGEIQVATTGDALSALDDHKPEANIPANYP